MGEERLCTSTKSNLYMHGRWFAMLGSKLDDGCFCQFCTLAWLSAK